MSRPSIAGPGRSYRAVLLRLTQLDDQAAAHRLEAEHWYDERIAAADEAERKAEQAVRDAEREVRAAQRDLEEVDARAAGLWSDFVHRVGPAAERYGRTVPEPVVPRQRGGPGPHDYLQEVATKMSYTPPARPLNTASQVLLGIFGAIGGTIGYAVSLALRVAGREAGGDWAVGLPVVALIIMLTGPVLGIIGAKQLADRRGVPLDATAVAIVLLTGLLTAALLHAALTPS